MATKIVALIVKIPVTSFYWRFNLARTGQVSAPKPHRANGGGALRYHAPFFWRQGLEVLAVEAAKYRVTHHPGQIAPS